MPSDDLVLNVRQIQNFSPVTSAVASDAILMQRGGLGGPYVSIGAAAFVGTALSGGGDMVIGGGLSALAFSGGSAQFSNAAVNAFTATKAAIFDLTITGGATLLGIPIATVRDVLATVTTFEGRTGDVCLWLQDIIRAGGAPNWSPVFSGEPRAPTPPASSNSSRLATTAFVQRNTVLYIQDLLDTHPFVFSFNGRTGAVVLTQQDILDAGGDDVFDSPTFTGVPIAPTAAPGTDTDQIATTAFVNAAIAGSTQFAPLVSPNFSGNPTAPTASPGSSTGQIATTAFVMNAVAESTAGVASFNTRTGIVTLEDTDISDAGGALLASPVFSGDPQAPTAALGTATAQLATTAFVMNQLAGVTGVTSFNTRTGAVSLAAADITAAGGALSASAALTGVPTAPTAALATSTNQIATTAFVMSEINNGAVASFNGRTGAVVLSANDISAAGGAALQSPAFLGTPSAPTAVPGTNSTQLATTAFVMAALASSGVASFNTRTGVVTLTIGDVTGVGGAPLSSPALSGTPSAPTAAPGTNTTQIATTAFVMAALTGGAGVASFNTRTGAVTLVAADITAAGGAVLSSPAFTGSPTGPTAAVGNSSTQLATTAFVQAALAAGAVTSFNGRTGAVTLIANDLTAAGGALLASPTFSGTPTAPTAPGGTNTGQIATTAFVAAAVATGGGIIISAQKFNASGTYTPPANLLYAIVECMGGGGSGGFCNGGANIRGGAGGGGSGGYSRSILTAAQIGASQPVVVAAGGVATTTGGAAGGASTFGGTLVTALGGGPGAGFDGTNLGVSGNGAAPGTGQLALAGTSGGTHTYNSASVATMGGMGGSMWGGGLSTSWAVANSANVGSAGRFNSGAGGSGSATNNLSNSVAGGSGGSGWVLVTEFSI
jgi:hypothetical protein